MEDISEKYKHIPGWGYDADPRNNPTYPMKTYTGADHDRLNYEREPQQPVDIEVLKSVERPEITRVFGTSVPPSGLSGMIRRFAFRFSESTYLRWFPLVLADRINIIEGYLDDFSKGTLPNPVGERGLQAEWKYNKRAVIRNVIIGAAITAAVVYLIKKEKNKRQMLHAWSE